MKTIILFLITKTSFTGYSQNENTKKEIISTEALTIIYANEKLYIEIKKSTPIHFQIWENKVMILNSDGSAKGSENFPVLKGKYKLVIFDEEGKSKTKNFHI
nr:hypothetical protein [uncultured Flavobacterium sp.]